MSSLTPNAATKKTASERKLELFCSVTFTYFVILFATFFHSGPSAFVQFENSVIKVEIAVTQAEKQKGLSGRSVLPQGQGLLFLYKNSGQRNIWMKDMRFPIDIVWMDANKTVTKVNRNILPSTYPAEVFTAGESTQFILEMPAGGAAKAGILEGQRAKFLMQLW